MKTKLLLMLVLFITGRIFAQYNNKNLTLAPEIAATKFTYGNLRIYPVYANDEFLKNNTGKNNYLSLKEALSNNKIKISEKSTRGESAEVNNLSIQNLSSDTIMILGGEVIEGGKQDRMIASDMIILPHSSNKDLKVFCVEHGRWTPKKNDASSYNFNSSGGTPMASPEIRKAGIVNNDQSMVWEKVKVVTDKNECKTSTGAYTALQNDTTYNNKIAGYRAFFTTILKADPKIIGAAYVTGNRILGCDLFASHDMYMKHAGNLINSYSTEAISNGLKVSIPYATVKSYIDKLLADEIKQDAIIRENGTMLKQNGNKLHIATY